MTKPRIAFLGFGIMGGGMACNLLADDLGCAIAEGESGSVELSTAAARAPVQRAIAAGHAQPAMSAVVAPLRKN